MICGIESNYHSNGMCRVCRDTIRRRLISSAKRHSKFKASSRLDIALFRQQRLAKKLLARFVSGKRPVPKARNFDITGRNNPVYEALVARFE